VLNYIDINKEYDIEEFMKPYQVSVGNFRYLTSQAGKDDNKLQDKYDMIMRFISQSGYRPRYTKDNIMSITLELYWAFGITALA